MYNLDKSTILLKLMTDKETKRYNMEQYIIRNADNLEYINRMELLRIIDRNKIRIHTHADGSRVELGKIPMSILTSMYQFTFNIIQKNNKEHYISN